MYGHVVHDIPMIHLCDNPLVGGYGGWSHTSALRLVPTRHDASSCQCILALMTSLPLRPL